MLLLTGPSVAPTTVPAYVPEAFIQPADVRETRRTSSPTRSAHLVGLLVHPADIQDRDGAAKLLATIRRLYPWLRHIFADGGYAGDKLRSEFHHIRDGTKALPGVQSQT